MSGRVQLDHTSVTVSDLDRSLKFYHQLLGIPLLGSGEEDSPATASLVGYPVAHFRYADLDLGGGQILELLQYLRPRGTPLTQRVFDPGSGHLGLRVDDVESTLQRLEAAGVRARSQAVELEGPAWWRGARCVYVSDPDGVTVELVQREPPRPHRSGRLAAPHRRPLGSAGGRRRPHHPGG